jgi:glyoxylase-like metal-dependent hydrolase (beta-lactamase superfamily II)/8-oxo-dGTP pyrophosphatase MutT (NUDIX family)
MAMKARPAATLALIRDSRDGPQVLMLQRTQKAAFLGGAYVFPGGALDTADTDPRLVARVSGLPAEDPPIAYWVAAIRECFEESGILLLCERNGQLISASRAAALAHDRTVPFSELLEREDLYLPAGELAYVGHWVTAPNRSRRFDARFFVALAPEGQQGSHDQAETVHDVWISPREALERGARGEMELVYATQHTLDLLKPFATAAEAMQHARSLKEVVENRACIALGREGEKIFRRADPPYFEIHWSDPEETGRTPYELVAGEPKKLDRWVTRLIAPNPGMMTGPGTNTYLVGEKDLAVIDPGPDIASHIEKILAFRGIKWVLCTHTHMDHSPAALAIKEATGAQLLGRAAPEGQDATFKPDVVLEHGQRVQIGNISIRTIHTPGHASNHLCYLLQQTKMLFTGDHVMQGSTVVINPPDGDMRAYLASLQKLLDEDVAILAPGHGYLIGEPKKEIRRLIAHRMAREEKVVAALVKIGPATLDELLPLVYDDVPARIHKWAARSLSAHLDKLKAEGALSATGGSSNERFSLVKSRTAG